MCFFYVFFVGPLSLSLFWLVHLKVGDVDLELLVQIAPFALGEDGENTKKMMKLCVQSEALVLGVFLSVCFSFCESNTGVT